MKTTQFVATVGPNPEYAHQNERSADRVRFVWQEEAVRHHGESGVLVGGFVTTGFTVYPPADSPNDRAWRKAVRAVAAAVGRRFGQDEVFVTFGPVEFTRVGCGGDAEPG